MIRVRGTSALLVRALRLDARSWWTYVARLGMVLMILAWLAMGVQQMQYMSAPGLMLFASLSYLNWAFIVLAGLSVFASVMTEEKEEGTLGLLRMTDLNALSIVLGKAGSRWLAAILLLVAQVPFTLLAVTLGGVSAGQIVSAYVALLAFTWMLANLALMFSVLCRETKRVTALVLLALILFHAVPWLLVALVHTPAVQQTLGLTPAWVGTIDAAMGQVGRTATVVHLAQILSTGYSGPILSAPVIAHLVAGVVFFGLALLAFERFSLVEGESAGGRRAKTKEAKLERRSQRRPRPWTGAGAQTWRAFYFDTGGLPGLLGRTLLILLISTAIFAIYWYSEGYRYNFRSPDTLEAIQGILLGMGFGFFGVELLLISGRLFGEELKDRTLSSLMLAPLSTPALLYGRLLGLSLGLVPALAVIAVALFLRPIILDDFFEGFFDSAWPTFVVCDLLAFLHVATYLSLWLRRTALAVAAGLFMVGHVLFGSCMGFMATMSPGFGDGEPIAVLLILLALGLCVALHPAAIQRLEQLASQE